MFEPMTIIIPYHRPPLGFFAEAIESALRQDCECDVMLYSDGLPTVEEAALIRQFDRRRLILHGSSEHRGVGHAIDDAVRHAKTPVVGILGSDDFLDPLATEKVLRYYDRMPGASFVYTQHLHCDSELDYVGPGTNRERPYDRWTVTGLGHVGAWHTFRVATYLETGGIDTDLECAEDRDLVLKMEERTRLHFLDEPVYLIRERTDSLSRRDPGWTKRWSQEVQRRARARRGI